MSLTWSSMALNSQVSSTDAANRSLMYTANNGIADIGQMTVYNSDSVARDIFIYIKSDATLTGALQHIQTKSIPAGATETLDKLIGHRVPASGSIQAHASATNVLYLTISGDERTQ